MKQRVEKKETGKATMVLNWLRRKLLKCKSDDEREKLLCMVASYAICMLRRLNGQDYVQAFCMCAMKDTTQLEVQVRPTELPSDKKRAH